MSQGQTKSNGDTRAAIMNDALLLFAQHGFDGVSVRDIVESVHITPGAIYHHFSGKRELYDLVLENSLRVVNEALIQKAALEGTPADQLRSTVRNIAVYLSSESAELRLVDRLIFEADDRGDETLLSVRVINGPRSVLARIVAELNADVPAEEYAEHVIAMVYGSIKLRPIRAGFESGDPFADPLVLADSVAALMLRALAPA